MHPHVSGTEHVGFLKARCSWEPGSQNSDIRVRTWNLVHGNFRIRQNSNLRVSTWNPVQPLNFPFSAFCGRRLLWTSIGRNYHSYWWPYACTFFFRKTVRFFFWVVIMNCQNIQACGTPLNSPTDGQTTEHILFPNIIMHYFCKIATY